MSKNDKKIIAFDDEAPSKLAGNGAQIVWLEFDLGFIPRIKVGERQTIETPINEEALLLAKYLRIEIES